MTPSETAAIQAYLKHGEQLPLEVVDRLTANSGLDYCTSVHEQRALARTVLSRLQPLLQTALNETSRGGDFNIPPFKWKHKA